MKLHIKRYMGKWCVWRDKHSSTYALPVTRSRTMTAAFGAALLYLKD